MATRRDNPKGSLWRIAVDGFNRVLIDDSSRTHMDSSNKDSSQLKLFRARLWKEVADVYEIFLVGSCGRALSSDELIETTVLRVLGDCIIKGQIDAPVEILQRLVTTLDQCASRVGSLPLESVGLMPSHCSRFSLSCLQMLFSLSSFTCKGNWSPARAEVSKVSLPILMRRCELILSQFLRDENDLGEHPLPSVRVEETICVLRELARLVIDYNTASVLPLRPNLKVIGDNENPGGRAHLFLLFPSFCDLVTTREAKVRELLQVVLRLVAVEIRVQQSAMTRA